MGRFLLGIIVVIAVAAGLYYLFFIDVRESVREEESAPRINIQVGESAPQKYIPPGAVMEDGTL